MRVRPVERGELDRLVAELWEPLAAEMTEQSAYDTLTADARERTLAYKREQVADDDHRTIVAVSESAETTAASERTADEPSEQTLLGYVAGGLARSPPIFTRGRELQISELYVRPAHRRAGIGTALLDELRAWGREQGCETASVRVRPTNEAARAAYEAAGFEVARCQYRASLDTEP